MRFIEQTVLGKPGGNCTAACLATVLGVDLSALPDLSPEGTDARVASVEIAAPPAGWDPQDWAIQEFVRPLGLVVVPFYKQGTDTGAPPAEGEVDVSGLAIATAWSTRVPGHGHSLVTLDGEVIWDPHPARHEGHGAIYGWLFFERDGRRIRPGETGRG